MRALGLRGFRIRLAAAIAISFTGLGAVFVAAETFVLSRVFDASVSIASDGSTDAAGAVADQPHCDGVALPGVVCSAGGLPADPGRLLSSSVGSGFLAWSLVLLAGFAVVSAVLAWVIARGPARRITAVSDAIGAVSEQDLSQRLRFGGPRDEVGLLADRIDGTLERLDAAFTRRESFLANASHELRTPLASGRAALEAPLSQGRFPADLEPSVRRAVRAYLRMEEAVDGLMLVATVSQIGGEDVADLSAADIVQRACVDVAHEAQERRVRISASVEDTLLVRGNLEAVDIAVRNLVTNAVRHNTEDGFVEIRVERRGSGESAVVALVVENTGAEVAEEGVADLLEPFNRGAASRQAGGMGLGLTIVSAIVSAHRGWFEVRPRTGGGLIAEVRLPSSAGDDGGASHRVERPASSVSDQRK